MLQAETLKPVSLPLSSKHNDELDESDDPELQKKQPNTSSSHHFLIVSFFVSSFNLEEQNERPSLDNYSDKEESENTSLESDEDFENDENVNFSAMGLRIYHLSKFTPPSIHSSLEEKIEFVQKHPIQPQAGQNLDLPFKPLKTYYRSSIDDAVEHRKWLSYSADINKIYCSVCMAFSNERQSNFVNGYDINIKHLYKSLVSHENSNSHRTASSAYIVATKNADVMCVIDKNLADKRKIQVLQRRKILMRVIDIAIFLGRQGLSFRGHREEAVSNLKNRSVNHGNFLELVTLVCKYDDTLNGHVTQAIKKSEAQEQHQIQMEIVKEIKMAVFFSIEVDSTQDIAVMVQLALCVRYVFDGEVKVRLLKLLIAKKTLVKLYTFK
ncbi:hypothetical protein JTE90_026937 [Oedothorax gibbosus]|uniref:C17orf113 probable zinc finger domain-containing protein n=1 Tax=Oedothorax gibbosus TaxID=931172 RepID=A0AAV6TWD8_9ARAC|nr:hypothetical protein JTE90_026937 [Oedothorax gibbosus]